MNYLQIITTLILVLAVVAEVPDTAGFEIGDIKGYKSLAKVGRSTLYEIDCPQIQDGKPFKLLELVGTHYEVGYAYGALLGK